MTPLAGPALLLALAGLPPWGVGPRGPFDAGSAATSVRALIGQDKVEEALQVAGAAADRWPEDTLAHAALGDALYRWGDFEKAESAYRRAVELGPDAAEGHFGLGRILRTLGRYGEAAESFSRAAALSPDTPKYLRILANHVARREDSVVLLRRYLELTRARPDLEEEPTVRNVEAWLALLESMGDRPLVELARKEPTTVPLQVVGAQAFLRIRVAGLRSQRFALDTGATGLTISHRIAARAKLAPIRPFTISGTGKARTETGDLVVVPEIAVGDGVVIRNVPATVRDPGGLEEGLIGPSLFSGFDITIDLKSGRLSLEYPSTKNRPGRAEPFRNVGGEIVIIARVNGEPLNAMLDTGSVSTIVGKAALSRAPDLAAVPARWGATSEPSSGAARGVGGPLADRKVILKGRLTFAGRDYTASGLVSADLTGFSHALESEVHVILGTPHLAEGPFTIDYRRMVVTFGGTEARSPAQR